MVSADTWEVSCTRVSCYSYDNLNRKVRYMTITFIYTYTPGTIKLISIPVPKTLSGCIVLKKAELRVVPTPYLPK